VVDYGADGVEAAGLNGAWIHALVVLTGAVENAVSMGFALASAAAPTATITEEAYKHILLLAHF